MKSIGKVSMSRILGRGPCAVIADETVHTTGEVVSLAIVLAFVLALLDRGQSLELATATAIALVAAITRSLRALRAGTVRPLG